MEGRRGLESNLSGPRLPQGDHADPDDGCFNGCGEVRPSALRTYQLVAGGRSWGAWRLCMNCLAWGNPPDPQAGDPLDATSS